MRNARCSYKEKRDKMNNINVLALDVGEFCGWAKAAPPEWDGE